MKTEKKVEIEITVDPIVMWWDDWLHMDKDERLEMIDIHIADSGLGYKVKTLNENKT